MSKSICCTYGGEKERKKEIEGEEESELDDNRLTPQHTTTYDGYFYILAEQQLEAHSSRIEERSSVCPFVCVCACKQPDSAYGWNDERRRSMVAKEEEEEEEKLELIGKRGEREL